MSYLLDTHTYLWWDSKSSELSRPVRDILMDVEQTVYVSLATIWEIQIKSQIGKLHLPAPLLEIIERQEAENGIHVLPVQVPHVLAVYNLPMHHRDPFDRILIAQTMIENMTLLSKDRQFAIYNVQVFW
ncbi:MAG: type II toxin-antitoxin system VapC family toxin [Anaerolineae bacterium]|nr:type II toxin-antitoxin system VapC family toxin [Anaerolineae bacterium]